MPKRSLAYLATQILSAHPEDTLLVVMPGEHRAETLGQILAAMAPERVCRVLPGWDCLPYDRAPPSAEVMGQRMLAIHDLASAPAGAILVTSPEGALQRLPPASAAAEVVQVAVGDHLDDDALKTALARFGYAAAAEVEEVGQYAIRGGVIDVFPAAPAPIRMVRDQGRVLELHSFDVATQRRRRHQHRRVSIGPVTEIVPADSEAGTRGGEHALPTAYGKLETVFTLLPDARVLVDPDAEERIKALFAQIAEAHKARVAADKRSKGAARPALAPARLYITTKEWGAAVRERQAAMPSGFPDETVPSFAQEAKVGRAFRAFLRAQHEAGRKVVLTAPTRRMLDVLIKQAGHATGTTAEPLASWQEVGRADDGGLVAMRIPSDIGFVDAEGGITLIAAADLLGSRASVARHAPTLPWHGGDGEFAPQDIIVHLDHGMGVLRGLETLDGGPAGSMETTRLDYAGGADLLSPVDDLQRIWRYGSGEEVSLDRLHGDGWIKRRARILQEIRRAATELVSLARKRDEAVAPKLVAPSDGYERFCAGFPFALTPDQGHAVADVLADLASGRAMDRIVVGDVGFGKTEVALRAAAAAVLAGRQVAVVAPTTVLVRQHVQTFARRFEALGLKVAQLSRVVGADEADAVRRGLADGEVRLVIGTHALMDDAVLFKDLGLLIIDEEQRFGAKDKSRLRTMGASVHALTLSATPIPRTLQAALVGLQEMSVIATAPARRRPIRTVVSPLDRAAIASALLAEQARGGQSFVVVPRISDLDRWVDELRKSVPGLDLVVAHGRLDAVETDVAMVGFAEGKGDVLLATSIIESGLDVPRANTMVVVDADRFGLAQLHQLRGRVGRGTRQGLCYLMTDPDRPATEHTLHRLHTLASHDRLGSGFAISLADLDARGAGDLLGDTQAGHLKLIGIGLYQHLLQRAVREARGEKIDDWQPQIRGACGDGAIPTDYVAEPTVRLNLYARLARATDVHDIEALGEEMEDRFGALPQAVVDLLARARLRSLCHSHAVVEIDIGPKALAFSLKPELHVDEILAHMPHGERERVVVKGRKLIYPHTLDDAPARLALATRLLGDMH